MRDVTALDLVREYLLSRPRREIVEVTPLQLAALIQSTHPEHPICWWGHIFGRKFRMIDDERHSGERMLFERFPGRDWWPYPMPVILPIARPPSTSEEGTHEGAPT